jgi:excinuclease ABC subunit C
VVHLHHQARGPARRFNPPSQPGCYLFKDGEGTVLYVGKAKNLRSRVGQYFDSQPKDGKTAALVALVQIAEFFVVRNEVEALLLENRLIKKYRPHYNILLKDDKRYAYLLVTDEKFPRLLTTRNEKAKGHLYGPYVDGFARKQAEETLNRIFKLRTCRKMPKRVCLQFHIGRCSGPCEGRMGPEGYADGVRKAEAVLKGEDAVVIAELERQMKEASAATRFELARQCRDAISAIRGLRQQQVVDRDRGYDEDAIGIATDGVKTSVVVMHVRKGVLSKKSEYLVDHADDVLEQFLQAYYDTHEIPNKVIVPREIDGAAALSQWLAQKRGTKVDVVIGTRKDSAGLVAIANKNAALRVEQADPALVALKDALTLPTLPRTIEVFDISTIQGTHTVGAMVQYADAKPSPANYRKFLIREANAQDDVACMREVVSRRYEGLVKDSKPFPDLIVIDGGQTQLNAAIAALVGIAGARAVPVISLAKEREEIFIPDRSESIILDDKNPGLLLLRRARDSVHRFVIEFHRKRRGKAMVASALDRIKGVGPATKAKLLVAFGSVDAIRAASEDKIAQVTGQKTAKIIKDGLGERA